MLLLPPSTSLAKKSSYNMSAFLYVMRGMEGGQNSVMPLVLTMGKNDGVLQCKMNEENITYISYEVKLCNKVKSGTVFYIRLQ